MDTYQYNRACRCIRCRSRGIMGPVIMITIGLLFLLDNVGTHGFDSAAPGRSFFWSSAASNCCKMAARRSDGRRCRPSPTSTAPPGCKR